MFLGIEPTFRTGVVALSWAIAVVLIVRVWRSPDPVLLKLTLTLICFVPILGPLIVYWISNFTDPIHPSLRDQQRYRSDVYDRWAHVLRMNDSVRRFEEWRRVRNSYDPDKRSEL